MSALLVPPSRSRPAPHPGFALRTITAETYRAFLATPAGAALGAGFLQCPSWADVKEGWRARLIGWGPDPEAGQLTGVALVLLRQFPGTRKYFAYLPKAPSPTGATPASTAGSARSWSTCAARAPSPCASARPRPIGAGTPPG